MLMIEEFEQRNRIFARNLRPILELRDRKSAALVVSERAAKVRDHVRVENQIVGNAHQLAGFDQSLNRAARESTRRGWLIRSGTKLLFDPCEFGGFAVTQLRAMRCECDRIALQSDTSHSGQDEIGQSIFHPETHE